MYSSHHRELRAGGRAKWAPRLVALLIASAGIGVAVAAASAASAVPRAPDFLGASVAHGGLEVKPATIVYTGDGTGFLGGASARRGSHIRWTEWTAQVALGTGFNRVHNCIPICALGASHSYGVRIELWRPRTLHGALVFTRMTIFYTGSHPRSDPQHYTFTDMYFGRSGGFGFGPPSASYCTQPGLGPVAGCENIHSLP
jgi:hypothetical protein